MVGALAASSPRGSSSSADQELPTVAPQSSQGKCQQVRKYLWVLPGSPLPLQPQPSLPWGWGLTEGGNEAGEEPQ